MVFSQFLLIKLKKRKQYTPTWIEYTKHKQRVNMHYVSLRRLQLVHAHTITPKDDVHSNKSHNISISTRLRMSCSLNSHAKLAFCTDMLLFLRMMYTICLSILSHLSKRTLWILWIHKYFTLADGRATSIFTFIYISCDFKVPMLEIQVWLLFFVGVG